MKDSPPSNNAHVAQNTSARPAVDLPRILLAIGTQLLLIGGSLYVLYPFAPALIWGTMIVVATWPVLRAALRLGRDIRVGLEDTVVLPDGRPASGNRELVEAAVRLVAEAS